MIDWTKPIETTDGRKARVLATDVRTSDNRPICVAYENRADSPGDEATILLARDGRYPIGLRQQFIRNVRVKREGWVNIYPHPHTHERNRRSVLWLNKGDADAEADTGRVACVRIEWEE